MTEARIPATTFDCPQGANVFFFPFTPQTHVRVTQNQMIWFKIPDEKINTKATLRHKRRIRRYFDYKETLLGHALKMGFSFPVTGSGVYFFIPMPKRWSKKKRKEMQFQPHGQKPDLSNLLKAYEDGLLKKDETIWHYGGVGKYWIDTIEGYGKKAVQGPGYIEVHLNLPTYNPLTNKYESNGL